MNAGLALGSGWRLAGAHAMSMLSMLRMPVRRSRWEGRAVASAGLRECAAPVRYDVDGSGSPNIDRRGRAQVAVVPWRLLIPPYDGEACVAQSSLTFQIRQQHGLAYARV